MTQQVQILRAALWILASMSCYCAMAVAGRQLAGVISTFELLFIRSVIGCAVISVLLCYFGWEQVRPRTMRFHLLHNNAHFGGQYAWFYALGVLPLAEVFAIEFTTPIWTALIAVLGLILYGEVLDPWVFAGAALIFIGNYVNVRGALTPVGRATAAGGGDPST